MHWVPGQRYSAHVKDYDQLTGIFFFHDDLVFIKAYKSVSSSGEEYLEVYYYKKSEMVRVHGDEPREPDFNTLESCLTYLANRLP